MGEQPPGSSQDRWHCDYATDMLRSTLPIEISLLSDKKKLEQQIPLQQPDACESSPSLRHDRRAISVGDSSPSNHSLKP